MQASSRQPRRRADQHAQRPPRKRRFQCASTGSKSLFAETALRQINAVTSYKWRQSPPIQGLRPATAWFAPHSAEKLSLASATERAHHQVMFDYDASADLYTKRSGMNVRRKTVYRRFSSAADAIHFAVERLTPEMLENALLEVDEKRFTADQIRGLYDDTTFPLQRNRRDGS
jgi:hypothetical protein